jgi:DNA (cytosine-5)-methyltransferase 1
MRKHKQKIHAVDLFCGAGGTSSGLLDACNELGLDVNLLAINHWDVAIATHMANHPGVEHLCTGVDKVNPRDLVKQGKIKSRIDLLVGSPECQHHSNARGGRPMSDQKRASAWHILWWLEALDVRSVLIENVPEFEKWGPLDSRGRPLKSKRGELYLQFVRSLEALGYKVEWKVCNAADIGAATSRKRLFLQAHKGRARITWPEKTHSEKPTRTLFGELKKYRPAREIIDWSIEGKSIYFDRQHPLSPNTMNRIYAGLQKFSGFKFVQVKSEDLPPHLVARIDQLQPFLIGAGGPQFQGSPRSVDEPMRTVLTRNHQALVQPFIVILRTHANAQSIEEPVRTICAQGNHHALVQPFIVMMHGQSTARSTEEPLSTICAHATKHALCQPYLVKYYTGSDAVSIDEPLPSVTANYQHLGLCQPFLVPFFGEKTGQSPRIHSIDAPLPAVTGQGAGGLVQPYLIGYHGNHNGKTDGNKRTYSVDEPLKTIDTSNRIGLVHPFLVKYYRTGNAQSVDVPLDTVTAKPRFGLVNGYEIGVDDELAILDLRFRMLQYHELALAMGFRRNYIFTGTRDQKIRQIGNAVEVTQAKVLCKAILQSRAPSRAMRQAS